MWRKGNPHSLLLGMLIGTATMENSMEVPQEIKYRHTIWCRNYTWGYLSEGYQKTNSKRYMHPYVHGSFIGNSQDVEATKVSIDRQLDKEVFIYMYENWTHTHTHTHTHTLEYYSAIKKNEIELFVVRWMELVCHTEWSKSEREKQILYANTYIWNLKNKQKKCSWRT